MSLELWTHGSWNHGAIELLSSYRVIVIVAMKSWTQKLGTHGFMEPHDHSGLSSLGAIVSVTGDHTHLGSMSLELLTHGSWNHGGFELL